MKDNAMKISCAEEEIFFQDSEALRQHMLNTIGISSKLMKAAVLFSSGKIEIGGLGFDQSMRIIFDCLPNEGYSLVRIDIDDKFEEFRVLKKLPMSYKDAVFYRGEAFILDREEWRIDKIHITGWKRLGYHSDFTIEYENGELRTISNSEYEKKYIFLA